MKKSISIHRDAFPKLEQGVALTIGNFDGIHKGHQQLLKRVVQVATEKSLVPVVMTFLPHAREFFAIRAGQEDRIPTRILPPRDKIRRIAAHHMEHICVQRFNEALASLSPEAFIAEILVKKLNVKWLCVGHDFHFGHKRMGTVETLQDAGKRYGFEVEVQPAILSDEQERFSSTLVRQALEAGDMPRVEHYMGQVYQLSGRVIHGRKLGRELGYPTLNIPVQPHSALRAGVYVVRVHGLTPDPLPGVASMGYRPTVTSHGRLLLEVHLFDVNLDAYGKRVQVDFLHFIRPEEKFDGLPTLIRAIQADEAQARAYFKDEYGLSNQSSAN